MAAVLEALLNDESQGPDSKSIKSALGHLQSQLEDQRAGMNAALDAATRAAHAATMAAEGVQRLMRMQSGIPSPPSSGGDMANPPPPTPPTARVMATRDKERIQKHLHVAGRDFEKVLRKYLTMTNVAKNITKELQDMQETYRHHPAGTRPFRSPYDLVELDEVWPAIAENDLVVGFTIEKGSTRKEAMEKVYYESVVKNKQILCGGILGHVEALKPKTTKEAFVATAGSTQRTKVLCTCPWIRLQPRRETRSS